MVELQLVIKAAGRMQNDTANNYNKIENLFNVKKKKKKTLNHLQSIEHYAYLSLYRYQCYVAVVCVDLCFKAFGTKQAKLE